MPPFLRRWVVPFIFAIIFIVIPFAVMTLATGDRPIVHEDERVDLP